MTDETDEVVEYARRRMIQMADWQQVLLHGTDEEKRALVTSLRDIDIVPVFSVLDEPEDEVRIEASHHRQVLALDELRRMSAEAIAAGDLDAAARLLDLRLSVENASYRDNGGRLSSP